MLMKTSFFFFFLILVNAHDELEKITRKLYNCFDNYYLLNNQIKDMDFHKKFTPNFENLLLDWNTLIQKSDQNDLLTIVFNIADHVCFTLLGDAIENKTHFERCMESAKICCNLYAKKVYALGIIDESSEVIIIQQNPYEHLVKARSEKKKVLPTLLHDDGMIIETDCQPTEGAQIVVLSKDTEDVDFIEMNVYF